MSYKLRCSELKPGPGDGDGVDGVAGVAQDEIPHSSARSMTSYVMHWLFSKTFYNTVLFVWSPIHICFT